MNSKNGFQLLDPLVLAKLAKIILRARFVVDGLMTGMHKSPDKGRSVEFSQHRGYSFGDEIKSIDWRVFARSDKYYVKEYEAETNLKGYLVLDTSASMAYHSDGISKLDYGKQLAASLAYLMFKQRDAFGLVTFAETIRSNHPPRSTQVHLQEVLNELENIQPKGETSLGEILFNLAKNLKRRHLVILISDLLDDPKDVLDGLKHFRFKKHEVVVFHLLDRDELTFPFKNLTRFEGMEDLLKITVDPQAIRKEYLNEVESFVKTYKQGCRQEQIDYFLIDTATPLEKAITGFVSNR
ncbi:MAG: DUF58 domain-containing protein [Candidatus Tectomicrobia bacterium]|uniref:DUF58 domain-containing protein n=1 Tax=Tectimicrobiota bacterium TaxID=2528274 RepID=A0A933GM23_UNCTE|nr:DUF58 domain-containing protein [Candidatus Tectomicrobia bacterium]